MGKIIDGIKSVGVFARIIESITAFFSEIFSRKKELEKLHKEVIEKRDEKKVIKIERQIENQKLKSEVAEKKRDAKREKLQKKEERKKNKEAKKVIRQNNRRKDK